MEKEKFFKIVREEYSFDVEGLIVEAYESTENLVYLEAREIMIALIFAGEYKKIARLIESSDGNMDLLWPYVIGRDARGTLK